MSRALALTDQQMQVVQRAAQQVPVIIGKISSSALLMI